MVHCPCSSCWAIPQSQKQQSTKFSEESRTFDIPAERELNSAEISGLSEAWRTASSDIPVQKYPEYYPDILLSDAATNGTDEPKVIVPKLPSEGTSLANSEDPSVVFKSRKPSAQDKHLKRRSNKMRGESSYRISRPSKLVVAGVSESGERNRVQTVISDWGEAYEDGDLRMSNIESSKRAVDSSVWSESVTPRHSGASRLESTLVLPKCQSSPLKMQIRPGTVYAMYVSKGVKTFRLLSLNTKLRDVVDSFLRTDKDKGPPLPVSFDSKTTRPKLMSESRMDMSLSDNLRGYLDPTTQGISFFAGVVNAKLCYKMTVCDLKKIRKMQRA